MKRRAIEKAGEHLDQAKEAALKLNLDGGFRPYERAWSQTLSQIGRFYSALEQGAKGCAASEPWFGQKKNERKADDLLAYLHHARNHDEHGLDYITQRGADAVRMGFPPTQQVRFCAEMMIDEAGHVHMRNPTVESPNGGIDRVDILNPQIRLRPVKDRGSVYHPPTTHAGNAIVDATPDEIAQLSIRYLERVLADARDLPTH